MRKVDNNETVVVGLLAGKADTSPTAPRSYVGMINAHVRSAVVVADQARVLGGSAIHVSDVSVGRIATLQYISNGRPDCMKKMLTVKKSNMSKKLFGE